MDDICEFSGREKTKCFCCTKTDVGIKLLAQKAYCKRKEYPLFAPDDGICYACHKQIYSEISILQAGHTHITGCPICHRSYCD